MTFYISLNDLAGGAILGQTAVRLPFNVGPRTIMIPAQGATVRVYERGTATPVNVYSTDDGSGAVATQPLTVDQDGSIVTAPGVLGYVVQPAELDLAVSGGPLASPRTIPVGSQMAAGAVSKADVLELGIVPADLGAVDVSHVGATNGVGSLDSSRHQPLSELSPAAVLASSAAAVQIGPRTGSTLAAPYLRDFVAADDFFTAGDTDDTARINLAATAAINKGLRLHVHGPRTVSSTINLRNPNSGNPQVMLDMDCGGSGGSSASPNYGYWTWAGGNTTSFVKAVNLVRSTWTGLKLKWPDSASSIVGFDLDTTTSSGTANADCNTFIGCHVALGVPTGLQAWRIGESSPSGTNISVFTWLNCTVTTGYRGYVSGPTSDAVGWRIQGNNALVFSWFGGGVSGCQCGFTTEKDSTGTFNGSNSLFFYALSCSYNAVDFQFCGNGVFTIHGGRFELGQRFIDEQTANVTPGTSFGSTDISVIGMMLGAYSPSDGVIFNRTNGGHMSVEGSFIYASPTILGASMFSLNCGGGTFGTLRVTDCSMYATAPFYTVTGAGVWSVYLSGNIKIDASNHANTKFADAPTSATAQNNYAATTDPLVGSDNTIGYSAGSEWVNTTTAVLYKCLSAATGAAVWFRVSGADVQVFTSTGTWTKPKWVSTTTVALIAGGGGGGSGRRGASGTAWSGGAGGGGGGAGFAQFNAAELPSSLTVTIGATGAGGAAQTVNDTNGNAGTASGQVQFGTLLRAQPGAGGAAGASGTSAGGPGGVSTSTGGAGGNGTVGAVGAVGSSGNAGGPGGGGGGGLAATPAVLAGGTGGQSIPNGAQAGGAGGTTDGQAGGAGTAPSDLNLAIPGSGGGGGASSIIAAGGAGGAGAAYGAGGAGGGASLNGQNSGAGGAPGAGVCVAISR